MTIALDDDAYPFVLQGFSRGPKTEPALRDLFRRMSVIAERAIRDRTVHVVVATGDEHFTAAERKVIADCMSATRPEEATRVIGAFAVIEGSVARGVLTALRWLAPGVIPVVAAPTPEEAVDLGHAALRKAGVSVALDVVARARIAARRLHDELRRPPAHD